MTNNENLEALHEIRNLMNKSVKFLSLSGLSGLFAGLYAIAASFVAFKYNNGLSIKSDYNESDIKFLVILAVVTLLLAIITAFIFTKNKAKKDEVKLWDHSSKNALISLSIPLVTGGLFCIALINLGLIGLLAPATLIFYGLSLISASKHTFKTIKVLGIIEIILGIINSFMIGYGLIFWSIGFGIMHIIYGIYMYIKFDKA